MAPRGFLRTRVARRMLGLFLACALVPLTLLALFGYRYVADELGTRAREQLRSESKAAGMILLDRLSGLTVILEQFAADPDSPRIAQGLDAKSVAAGRAPQFRSVIRQRADGQLETLAGPAGTVPPVDAGMEAHLSSGEVGLVATPQAGEALVYLVLALEDGGRMWGLVEGTGVWGDAPDRRLASSDLALCLVSTTGFEINCPQLGARDATATPDDGAIVTWGPPGKRFIAGHWTIFLGRAFAAPSWRIVLSLPERDVLAPLATLQRTFIIGLLLALATVFALTHVQLRRQTAPLEALEEATHRVARGRFDQPVAVQSDDEFGTLARAFNTMSSELGTQFDRQAALQLVHREALSANGAGPVLAAIFAGGEHLIPGAALSIALARPDDPFWWTVSTIAPTRGPEAPRDVRPGEAELDELRQHPDGFVVRRGERGRTYFEEPEAVVLTETMVLPLVRRGIIDGAIVVQALREQEGNPDALAEVRQRASQLAVAIANTQLLEQLDAMNWGTLTAFARTIDAVSPWTAGHSERVTLGAIEIGRRLGLTADDLDLLHRGGLLHDIGKVAIPAGILDKAGKLEPEEYELVKQHPTIGARILAPIGAIRRALPLVLHHHELLDGSGYPHGLAGDQIPLLVRILTVADVFDALVSERPYRAAWPVERAVEYLRENAGTKFDAACVEALVAATATGWRPVSAGAATGLRGGPARPVRGPELVEAGISSPAAPHGSSWPRSAIVLRS